MLSGYAGAHCIGALNLKALAKIMKLQQALAYRTVEYDPVIQRSLEFRIEIGLHHGRTLKSERTSAKHMTLNHVLFSPRNPVSAGPNPLQSPSLEDSYCYYNTIIIANT
jgi:hypothetical protein